MSGINEQVVENGVFEEVAPSCVELVALAAPAHQAPKFSLPRPDSTFVTQLIATAEQLPQTRNLRRAAPADALSAYRAHERPVRGAGTWTLQIV